MANRSADFNYKVALASGLKSLQARRLRQAEEQFRYLVQRFPAADGGYRGLAKVLVEQDDRAAALRTLVEGGASLAKAGNRGSAIALYREAVALEPADRTAHRRLAAALVLNGDADDAANEYVRYVALTQARGDTEAARLELQYALERLPDHPALVGLARDGALIATTAAPAEPADATPEEPDLSHSRFDARIPGRNEDRDSLVRSVLGSLGGAAPSTPASSWETPPPTSAERAPAAEAWTQPAASTGGTAAAAGAWEAPAAPTADAPAVETGADAGEHIAGDDESVEAAAARFLAKREPRAGQYALEAARRYIAAGRMDAASDILLQLIAAGIEHHDAQRLLVEVTKSLGRRDVTASKLKLLVEALRLDGRTELAAEVEQLAQAG